MATNIEELHQKLQTTIKNLVDKFFKYTDEEREKLLYSISRDSFDWSGCDSGAVTEFIYRVLKKYNKEYVDKDDFKIDAQQKIYNGLQYIDINNNKYLYHLKLNIDTTDRFIDDLDTHYQWIQKGFDCEHDFIYSICDECVNIYQNYWSSKPCNKCGKVWWTSSI